MNTFPELPAIFIIPQSERAAAWKGRKLTVQGRNFRSVDAAEEKNRKRLQREYDKQQAEKRAARFAELRERSR